MSENDVERLYNANVKLVDKNSKLIEENDEYKRKFKKIKMLIKENKKDLPNEFIKEALEILEGYNYEEN